MADVSVVVRPVGATRVAFVVLDAKDKEHNTINRRFAESLAACVERVGDAAVKGEIGAVIFVSAKRDSFVLGADIEDELCAYRDPAVAARDSQRLQLLFNAIEDLPVPTIALVWGHCLGGGLELALACDYRLAVRGATCSVGLPEVKLGLIPGAGGCVRLARLIGIARALPLVLRGTALDTDAAIQQRILSGTIEVPPGAGRKGSSGAQGTPLRTLVGECATPAEVADLFSPEIERLWSEGRCAVSLEGRSRQKYRPVPALLRTWFAREFMYLAARFQLSRATAHAFPAPRHALFALLAGFSAPREAALALEARHFGRAAVTPEAKSLLTLFRAGSNARRRAVRGESKGRAAEGESDPKNVAVVGAAHPSASIVHAALKSGANVHVIDVDEAATTALVADVAATFSARPSGGEGWKLRLRVVRTLEAVESAAVRLVVVNAPLGRSPLVAPANTQSPESARPVDVERAAAVVVDAVAAAHAHFAVTGANDGCVVAAHVTGWTAPHVSRAFSFIARSLAVPTDPSARKGSSLLRSLARHAHPPRVCGMCFTSVATVTAPGIVAPPATCAELFPFDDTDAATTADCARALVGLGRTPVLAPSASVLVVDRLMRAWASLAATLVLNAGCSIAEVERTAVQFGFPTGPFGLVDRVGLVAALDGGAWAAVKASSADPPSAADIEAELMRGVVDVLLRTGCRGCEATAGCGRGFLEYRKGRVVGVHARAASLVAHAARERSRRCLSPRARWSLLKWGTLTAAELRDAVVLSLANEACRVAAASGVAVEEVDLLCVLALGFPAHHGGPISYADRRGTGECVRTLSRLASALGSGAEGPLAPCASLVRAASTHTRYYPLLPPEPARGVGVGDVPFLLPMHSAWEVLVWLAVLVAAVVWATLKLSE